VADRPLTRATRLNTTCRMRGRCRVLVLLSIACISCSTSPARLALGACNAWTSVGIGDPYQTPSHRKTAMDRAVRLADQAARADSRWTQLSRGLKQARSDLSFGAFSVQARMAAGTFEEIEPSCQAAGQPP